MTRVVGAAILLEGKLLVALRGPGQRQAGLWELPGGKVEPGEDDAGALARELREELGVDAEVGQYLGEVEHTYSSGAIVLAAYTCTLVGGVPRAREHAELRWVDADTITELTFAPADRPLLPAVVACL